MPDRENLITMDNLEALVEQHRAFLIRTVSSMTGRYVSIENDDEFSIALSAFAEAVERYQEERGHFLPFAALVIRSRLKTWLARENRQLKTVSLEALQEEGLEPADPRTEGEDLLKEEVRQFREELALFHLTLEDLAEHAPKHRDTKERAVGIAEHSSENPPIVRKTYQKKRLPIRDVARHCAVTEKIVRGSRHFILGIMLIFVRKYPVLLGWLEKGRYRNV